MPLTGAVADFLAKETPGVFGVTPAELAVGVVAVQALPSNPERVNVAFVNVGATVIMLCVDPQVSPTRGIRLAANGGSLTLNLRDDGILTAWDWYAVSDAAGGALFILTAQREAEA